MINWFSLTMVSPVNRCGVAFDYGYNWSNFDDWCSYRNLDRNAVRDLLEALVGSGGGGSVRHDRGMGYNRSRVSDRGVRWNREVAR